MTSTAASDLRRNRRYALMIVLGAFGLFQFLNWTGFCYGQFRYVREKELIEIAARMVMARYEPHGERNKYYSSLEDFFAQNPNCCEVHYGSALNSSPLGRVVGFYDMIVEVHYRMSDTAPKYKYYDALIRMNACGRRLENMGIPEERGPRNYGDTLSPARELFFDASRTKMSSVTPMEFFLEQPPTESQLSQIPQSAKDVVIAKVRIDGRFAPQLLGHAPPPQSDIFAAAVEVIELLRGDVSREEVNVVSANNNRIEVRVVGVYFGVTSGGRPQRLKYPNTLTQMSRDYFIVSHLGNDRKRRLIGFPVTDQEYELWDKEVREERLRDRSGGR
jgi:hypothetical protein